MLPKGIKNGDLWTKAKSEVGPKSKEGDYDWAKVLTTYKGLGGEATAEAEEAATSGAMGQLLRAGESWHSAAQQFVSLREALIDGNTRRVKTVLVTEGPGNSRDKNYYTDRFVEAAARAYEGARAYLNHASDTEYRNRPEGDVRVMCGFYSGLTVETVRDRKTGQLVKGVCGWLNFAESEAGREGYALACAQVDYSKIFPDSQEEFCGLSISGTGILEGKVDYKGSKWNRIVGVGQADSVDVVTRPARGGAFLALTESAAGAQHLSTEDSMNLKKLMALTAELTEAHKELKAATEATRESAQDKVDKLTSDLDAAAKKMNEADKGKKDDKDDDDLAALKKLMPKGSEEADDAYSARIAKVKALKGEESVKDNMTADELRKKFPKTFEAVASRVRESEAEKGDDIKAVKSELREAKQQLQVLKDKELATKLLSEAGVPVKFLSVGDLLGLEESEMRREIERTKAIIEATTGGRGPIVPVDLKKKGGNGGENKLAESIRKMRADAGIAEVTD